MEMESERDTVYCKAMCGNNFHKECISHWATTKRATTGRVTCPCCRTEWIQEQADSETLRSAVSRKETTDEGYVNIADELGISRERG